MDALRVRVGPVVEWIVAAAFLAATLLVASLILGVLHTPRPVLRPASVARPVLAGTPAVIPDRAVSVPVLPFRDGREVRVGDTASAVAKRLGRAAEDGQQYTDQGSLGERLTRFYEYGGLRFILVFEPFERSGEPRVAAIYLP
jgi:hypothetical protein